MPIYAYECKSCGKQAEYIQKFSDEPKSECEHCGGALQKLISAPAFHLKGGGWYADGYASAGDTKKAETPKADGGDAPAKSKGESKPAPKSDGGSAKKKPSATGSD